MTEILNIALSVLGALVTAAVTALSKVLIGLIKEKIGGEKAKRAAEAARPVFMFPRREGIRAGRLVIVRTRRWRRTLFDLLRCRLHPKIHT